MRLLVKWNEVGEELNEMVVDIGYRQASCAWLNANPISTIQTLISS